ncbi:hypothetical protein HKD37_17G048276 [Glycine soja]
MFWHSIGTKAVFARLYTRNHKSMIPCTCQITRHVGGVVVLSIRFMDSVNSIDRPAICESMKMATPSSSPPPIEAASQLPSTLKRTRKVTRLRSLATRPTGADRPMVHVDPVTGKADNPHKKKLRTYLGIVARDKVDVTYKNWKQVLVALKDLIWEDILSTRTMSMSLYAKNSALAKRNGPNFARATETPRGRMCGKRHRSSRSETHPPMCCLMGTTREVEDGPHKKNGQMTSEAAKEIAEKIDLLEEQASQGLFVPHGGQDVLTAAIGRPEHLGRVRAAGAGVTIKQYFGPAQRTSHTFSFIAPEELEHLTQKIRDQLEESIIEKVTRQLMLSFSQMQSQFQSQMQSQGLALPPEPEVGPSVARVSTKGSYVDLSATDPDMGNSNKCGLYIEENPPCLVALGRVYEGSTFIHNIPLLHDQVKVGVEEVKDVDAPIPVPTDEVILVGQTLNTFLAWPTHLVVVGPAKPTDRPNPEVDDPLYLMTLTIPQLFLKPLQVMWDISLFGLFNSDFPLYIKHEDLSKIAHGGQCLSISSSKRDAYLGAYLNRGNLVVWFCSLHNRPDNYLKEIINSQQHQCFNVPFNGALKGLDDTPQPKSKVVGARWIVVKYFNDVRPLKSDTLKALHIQ